MAAPATANEFLDLVRKSGVLDPARFAELYPDPAELPADPQACAAALIKAGLLTTFQSRQLLAGKFRGFVLGAYKILQPLGKGGMGQVFLGEHADLKRKVALKVLPADKAGDKLALERFYREARSAAALDHPNIVRLYDISQGGGVHFLIMEYVEGNDLQSLMAKTGPLHFAQAAHYVAQAAAGLQHAHEKGFVHRDIKPANLILAKDGTVKILDMGLARSYDEKSDNLTANLGDGEVVGTADYVSPEQALGQQVDERSDIYSLGATLFALVTGVAPFKGNLSQILMQHQMAEPPSLTKKLKVAVPPALNDVVAKMMAKRKGDRYQSAADVIDALGPWLPAATTGNIARDPFSTADLRTSGLTAQKSRPRVDPPADGGQGDPPADRKKLVLIGGGVGVVVLAGVLAAVFMYGGDAKPPAAQGGPTGQTLPQSSGDSRALVGHTAAVNDVVISPDGTRVGAIDWSGHLVIWDAKTGKRLHTLATRPGGNGKACATTPDGHLVLAVGEKMPVLAYDWKTGQEVREYPAHDGTTWGLAVSPSGKHLLTSGNDGTVVLRDLATGDEIRRFEFEAKTVWSVAFSADGTKMAAGTGSAQAPGESYLVKVWDVADGKELHRLTGHTRDVRSVGFRPDGRVLASAGFDGTVRLWDLATGKEAHNIAAHDGYVERVFFLPGGKRLLTCGGPLANAQQTHEGGALKVWDADTGLEVKGWRGDECNGLIALFPSKDGRIAATGSRDKLVRIWTLPPAR